MTYVEPTLSGQHPPLSYPQARLARSGGDLSVTLRPKRSRLLRLLLLSLLTAGAGCVAPTFLKILALSFFGACAAIAAIMLVQGASYLKLNARGFECCSLFRVAKVRWTDVDGFGVALAGGRQMVGYNDCVAASRHPVLADLSATISGFQAALPDTYGLEAAQLAALMNEMRARAVASSGSASGMVSQSVRS